MEGKEGDKKMRRVGNEERGEETRGEGSGGELKKIGDKRREGEETQKGR